MIENYYFVKRRIQFILKFPQNLRTSAIGNHPRVEGQWIKEEEEEKEKKRKAGKGREEKGKKETPDQRSLN